MSAGRWIATNSPNERTGVGYVPGRPPGVKAKPGVVDFIEHDCRPPAGDGGTWTCACGRSWRWSPRSGLFTWGQAKRGGAR